MLNNRADLHRLTLLIKETINRLSSIESTIVKVFNAQIKSIAEQIERHQKASELHPNALERIKVEVDFPLSQTEHHYTEQAKNYRIQRATLVVTVLTLIALGVYTLYTRSIWLESRKSADAATSAAKAADDAVTLARETSHRDQRAWVSWKRFEFPVINVGHSQGISIPRAGEKALVKIYLINTGKTPAVEVWTRGEVNIGRHGIPESQFRNTFPEESRGIIPVGDIGFWTQIESALPLSNEEIGRYTSMLSAPINRRDRDQLWVHAVVHYRDVFGCKHFMEVSGYHPPYSSVDAIILSKANNGIDDINNEDCK